jgi:cytidylate kinase
MIIAIDGPAAAGKGTLAKRLAAHYSMALLDTGLLYRAVGYKVLALEQGPEDTNIATEVAEELMPEDLESPNLRNDEVAQAASKVSAVPGVRAALLEFQQDFARNPPGDVKGAILDGRDIGTVVCPNADAKLFITASVEVRAERRLKELLERDVDAIYACVLQNMKERDARDSGRVVSPLVPAQDALQLDTSTLDVDAVFAKALKFIDKQNCS